MQKNNGRLDPLRLPVASLNAMQTTTGAKLRSKLASVFIFSISIGMISVLTACGQRGALYLPERSIPAQTSQPNQQAQSVSNSALIGNENTDTDNIGHDTDDNDY